MNPLYSYQNCSVGGLSNFFGENRRIRKWFWFITFLGSIILATLLIKDRYDLYVSRPVSVKYSLEAGAVPMAAVTICNLNAVKQNMVGMVPELKALQNVYGTVVNQISTTEVRRSLRNKRRQDLNCPVGWNGTEHGCYKMFPEVDTYMTALETCFAAGGTLPHVRSTHDLDSLVSIATVLATPSMLALNGEDTANESRWVVTDTNGVRCKQAYFHWDASSPNTPPNQKDFIFVNTTVSNMLDSEWVSTQPFLCQKPNFHICGVTGNALCAYPPNECVIHEDGSCLNTSAAMETRNFTPAGIDCQQWSSSTPHSSVYPELDGNRCVSAMSPGDPFYPPWCYTMDPALRWDYCYPLCEPCNISDVVNGNYSPRSTPILPPTLVDFTCDDGFHMLGHTPRKCMLYGIPNPPECKIQLGSYFCFSHSADSYLVNGNICEIFALNIPSNNNKGGSNGTCNMIRVKEI